jgi:cytochrome c553
MRPVVLCFFVGLLSMPIHIAPAHAADGRDIAAGGNGRDAPACSACHGAQGEGRPDLAYPRLAGLDSAYLIEQLNAFADGGRNNEAMVPIAKALTADERQAIAKFYAGLATPKVDEPQKADDKTIAAGAALASRGDWSKGDRAGRRKGLPHIGGSVGRIYNGSVESVEGWQADQRSPASHDRHIRQTER